MRHYLDEFRQNLRLMDRFFSLFNQSVLNPATPKTLFAWLLKLFPIIYVAVWIAFYSYQLVAEQKGIDRVAQQIWVYMSLIQVLVKLVNALLQTETFKALIDWCESAYTTQFKHEYQVLINDVFENTNRIIALFYRWWLHDFVSFQWFILLPKFLPIS